VRGRNAVPEAKGHSGVVLAIKDLRIRSRARTSACSVDGPHRDDVLKGEKKVNLSMTDSISQKEIGCYLGPTTERDPSRLGNLERENLHVGEECRRVRVPSGLKIGQPLRAIRKSVDI